MELNKWKIVDAGDGGTYEVMVSGPSAHLLHDKGGLKVRRVVQGERVASHGRRLFVEEEYFEQGREAELEKLADEACDMFRANFWDYPLEKGKYVH
jgi:hypothetical protein